jgi:hypothetical protein
MATIVLSAAGMALGGAMGGSVLGLSTAVVGRAAGAMLGRSVDERLLGSGSAPVETGRVDRFRLTGASEGAPVARAMGAVRLAGQVIWATRFQERSRTTGGGKGGPPQPEVTELSYTVSLAVALCEGEITGVGRLWADGAEIARDLLDMRVYPGSRTQLPDPRMEAVEGAGAVPAYRGVAYVVIEDLPLGRFGNRVPQLSFEVFRPAPERPDAEAEDLSRLLRAVALIPGTGEYALATTPVNVRAGWGRREPVNMSTPQDKADLLVSLDQLQTELPRARRVSLIVSWFGSDLRLGSCPVRPKVERHGADGEKMPWRVSGLARSNAMVVTQAEGRPVYGGTPADASVVQAIEEMRRRGLKVMLTPFVLMDQGAGNVLPDPYTGAAGQPKLPWRGRITLSKAPGQSGSPDGTAAADAEVAAFFGAAQPHHFANGGYTGPAEWSYRRMVLHYAHLCARAGGVDTFCVGSELVGITTIRGATGYPAVQRLRTLAAEVKAIVPGAKVTYAADWTEWSGHQPTPGTRRFHLDPLWADPAIDAIGIDNYLPLSDWRDGEDHLDARWGRGTDLDYLSANVAGGELYDWFYASDAAREAQTRTPITDGAGEPWVWRLKDLRGWWSNPHHDRVAGVRQPAASPWVPRSKPIWFTEIGCAAIDKGSNEPNKFLDPKSSESSIPHHSSGLRDDFAQMQHLRALYRHYADPEANPASALYGGPMVDMDRAHVWAWDARPFPAFPSDRDTWSDGPNWLRGHWINGRASARSLASAVEELCRDAGAAVPDTRRLHGVVRGMLIEDAGTARAALQPLMLAHGFDAVERDGVLTFRARDGRADAMLDPLALALAPEAEATLLRTRAPEAETAGRVQVSFVESGGAYAVASADAALPDDPLPSLSRSQLPLVMTRDEGRAAAQRWLAEARVARDTARFGLPPSRADLGPGDTVRLDGALWRVDRVEDAGLRQVEATRVEPETYRPFAGSDEPPAFIRKARPVPIEAVFLDLPLLTGLEVPHAPHVAMTAEPWPGLAALAESDADEGYAVARTIPRAATMGETLTVLAPHPPGRWDRGPALRVRLAHGELSSVGADRVLAGASVAAIGDGSTDAWEVIQFAEALLVAPMTYDLRLRLRGQAGTDGQGPWPPGSRFVLLNGAPVQWDFPAARRDVERHYRWGPTTRPMDDPSWQHAARAFRGAGLRPFRPCHLRRSGQGGDALLTWVRRTRIDGDNWTPRDVPLGEDREAYVVRVIKGGTTLREVEVAAPAWTYTAAMRGADGPGTTVAVAQLSDRWGPGPEATLPL